VNQKENEYVYFKKNKNIYFNGYFQSEKYFIKRREDLLKIFKFPKLDDKNEGIKTKISNHQNSVSIHIRRGDYLKDEIKKYHGILDEDYYNSAIKIIQEKYKDAQFFVFSDDENFVKKKYNHLENFNIIEGNTENSWKDMALMTYCKHHVIANSSFSWWGAWLSSAENSLKIAPKNWFNPQFAMFDINDFIPKNWIKL
jgi:hypothetical protein